MTPEQNTRAIVHNAADRAMSNLGFWVPLRVRIAITKEVLAALAEHGLVVVRAEDIRAVLGPDPGMDAYVARGHDLLAAVEPSVPEAPARGSEPPRASTVPIVRVVGSTDDPMTVGTPTALRERIADRLLAFDADRHHGVIHASRDTALLLADQMLVVIDGALTEALRRAQHAEAAVIRVRELHVPVTRGGVTICDACSPRAGDGPRRYVVEPHPCDTFRALDVPADGEQTVTPATEETP